MGVGDVGRGMEKGEGVQYAVAGSGGVRLIGDRKNEKHVGRDDEGKALPQLRTPIQPKEVLAFVLS